MIDFETYKNNIDTDDKFNLSKIDLDTCVNYRGPPVTGEKPAEDKKVPSLAAAIVGLNNTAAPLLSHPKYHISWTDIDAQELFLSKKPTCYLILGKPGLGAYSLGEAISKKLNCIHICPKNVILDEIEQNTPTGRCLDFNMKHNKVVKFDIVFRIIKKKIESPAIKHRGYVLSGLPHVTTSRNETYLHDSLHGEDAVLCMDELLFDVIYNLKRKKSKKPKDTTESSNTSVTSDIVGEIEEEHEEQEPEEGDLEEEEPPVVLPKFLLNECSDVIFFKKAYMDSKKAVLLQQFNSIMNLSMRPDFIIYLTCPDADVIRKKNNKKFNYKNSSYINESYNNSNLSDIRWPVQYTMNDHVIHYEKHVFFSKYNCRHPMNFKKNSSEQICNYKHHLLDTIENKIEEFEPSHIIKLDGRTSVSQMMRDLTERLLMSHTKTVLIPEPLYLEEPPDDMEEFWKLVEELNVIHSGGVNFNRCASPWFNRCPVELKKRQSIVGRPKFAVTFFKHVYLMSSLPSMISFCRNPRPFLKSKYLETTCRIVVMGSKGSGKTMISKCLAWIFDAPCISYDQFLEDERKKKYDTYAKSILSEIIATIEDARFMKWQNAELERAAELDAWYKIKYDLLCKYLPLLIESLKFTEPEQPGIDEQEEEKEIRSKTSLDPELLEEMQQLRSRLSFMPIIDDVKQCEAAVSDKNILLLHAPLELTTPILKPGIPALGDQDVTEAISDYILTNDLQKEMEPTPEELITEIAKVLGDIDNKIAEESQYEYQYGKYVIDGLPSDSEYWDFVIDLKIIPDYTIVLIENREVDPDLVQHYINVEKLVKQYENRFLLANDPLITTKLSTKMRTESNTTIIQEPIIDDVDFNTEYLDTIDTSPDAETVAAFTESIEKFRENWEALKLRLEDSSKAVIEVELEEKSDVQITEEVLLKLRQSYYLPCIPGESEEPENEDDDKTPKDLLTFNIPYNLCETNIYCPIAYYDHGILWKGKPEFFFKYDNKVHYFSKEENVEIFSRDVTKYQSYNKPFKSLPSIRICVIGCIGSGKTTISKYIAKELGLLHIDFAEIVNDYLMPRHFKKVGRKYENSFTDVPIDEEGAVELQMDEENLNLEADMLSNEVELRRMLYNYFEQGSPLLSILLKRVIKKLWFQEPFLTTGFVLDGFPRMPSDIEDMIAFYCMPDLVIELECNSELSVKRLSTNMFKTWKIQINEAKQLAKIKFNKEKDEWLNFITKTIVTKLIYDEIVDNVIPNEEPEKVPSNESVVIDADPMGSTALDTNLFNAYNEIVEQFPEPVDLSEWEKSEDARERIDARIEGNYEVDDENIQALKDVLYEQKIDIVTINGNKPLYKVLRFVISNLSTIKNRNVSHLEQTFIIDSDVAEILLVEGFYFLSKFNRVCPVYLREKACPISNPYNIFKRNGQLYTVAHRSYIYFIDGPEAVIKFRTNPLKYVINSIKHFIEYPLRISVIGPPKSGKSSLATKLAKKYGLLCFSRGVAARFMLENMHWTELSSKMTNALDIGECLDTEFIMNAVQSHAIDPRTNINGIVFDGFPETPPEAMNLLNVGLYPLLVIDISSTREKVLDNSQSETHLDILKYMPPYSRTFIDYKYTQWYDKYKKIRDWINDDLCNLYVLNGNSSKWQCFQDAVNIIDSVIPKVHYYFINVKNKIVPADVMCISNESFQEKMSVYKNMCPVCLRNNVLRHSGFPVDKKGLVQYKNKLYWICSDHMCQVLRHPSHYLNALEIKLPEVPAVVKTVNMSLIYENGVCIVTYAENLPNQKIITGSNKHAANFQGITYLFCSDDCLKKFLAKPHNYFDIIVFKEGKLLPKLSLKKLPNIGYLEQTVGDLITEACCSVNVIRPKYPGLDIQLSALLYIALYLKTHNALLDKSFLPMYQKSFKIYEARCKLMIEIGLRLRSMDNPFAKYPKCCGGVRMIDSSRPSTYASSTSISAVFQQFPRRVPVPDERYDYLCEYHKPASKVPAFLNVVDIAGLVRGAAEGQGLGNAFLSHIKACDAIFNLCRAFDDEDVIHVDGEVNPVRDLETIGEELRLKDEEQLMQNLEKLERTVGRGGDKKLKPEYDSLLRIKAILVDEKKHIRFGDWSAADIEILNKYLFLTSKPALYLVNLSEKDYIRKKNKWLPKLKEWIDKNDPGAPLVPFSGVLETKLLEMEPAEKQAFLKEHSITSALDKIIVQGYKALQLEYFFTAGADEVKAWTIQKGTKAPQAAGRIHTDFEKGFIMAEVMHFKDFKEEGTEAACKSAGKYRQQGRNYVVEDGDIIFFKFNAGAGLKDAKKK